jgi:alpha-D-xyloside xylohydrolase
MRRLALLATIAACGDNVTIPPTITAGPVTIDTQTLAVTVASNPAMTIDSFLAIGEVDEVDEAHYYDPTQPDGLVRPTRAIGVAPDTGGDWIVLDDGTKLRLRPGSIAGSAELELDASGHAHAVQLQVALPRDPAEPIYGTGDAPLTANVAGQLRELELRVDLRSESGLNETHVPVPLVLWPRRGVGLFVADDRPGALDLGKADPTRVTATFTAPARGTYRVFIYTADTPLDLVRDYVALTAKPAVPPRWAFAPMQWRNEWKSSDEVRGDADAMRARHIPGSTIWIDNPWETAYNTFDIDETRFAQPAQLLADLRAQGYNVILWSTPYVDQAGATAADYAEAIANDYVVTDDADVPLLFPWQNGPGLMVDFTKPDATAWWQHKISKVTSIGVRGFKLDFGEEIVPDIGGSIVAMKTSAGDNTVMHARFAGHYHRAYLDALTAHDGFLLTRAGAWGEQQFNTSIWPGDLDSDLSVHGVDNGDGQINVGGLPSAISRGLSLSVSGYPFFGSDIGGFRDGPNQGAPTTETLLRWAEYAALGTIMQLGGGGPHHNPWDSTVFDPGADVIYKQYAELHMLLNPYLWTLASQAGVDGTPVTRPAGFVYDCACDPAMFLLGDAILVAPVIVAGATTRDVVLPPGSWVDRWTGAHVTGDGHTSITVPAPLDRLPMWYAAGSLVPMFAQPADTLLPASVPGVTSYANPALGGALRLVYSPGPAMATTTVHDGTRATGNATTLTISTGSDYRDVVFDIDGRGLSGALNAPTAVALDGVDLPAAADQPAFDVCSGCWLYDAASHHVQIHVVGPSQDRTVEIR